MKNLLVILRAIQHGDSSVLKLESGEIVAQQAEVILKEAYTKVEIENALICELYKNPTAQDMTDYKLNIRPLFF